MLMTVLDTTNVAVGLAQIGPVTAEHIQQLWMPHERLSSVVDAMNDFVVDGLMYMSVSSGERWYYLSDTGHQRYFSEPAYPRMPVSSVPDHHLHAHHQIVSFIVMFITMARQQQHIDEVFVEHGHVLDPISRVRCDALIGLKVSTRGETIAADDEAFLLPWNAVAIRSDIRLFAINAVGTNDQNVTAHTRYLARAYRLARKNWAGSRGDDAWIGHEDSPGRWQTPPAFPFLVWLTGSGDDFLDLLMVLRETDPAGRWAATHEGLLAKQQWLTPSPRGYQPVPITPSPDQVR